MTLTETRPNGDRAPAGTSRLELRDVVVRFGGITALAGVNLAVGPGQVCGVMGPNGAGKTTLFDVICGLRTPSRGTLLLDGVDMTSWSPTRRARSGVRRTFQQLQLFGWLCVLDSVIAAAEWRGRGGGVLADAVRWPARMRSHRQLRDQAMEALERCGVAQIAGAPSASLPIGQARLVELARALVDRPRLLLLDEPSSGLGEREAAVLSECVEGVRADGDCAVLLVEHDVQFVMRHSDEIVVMQTGTVLATGTPAEIRGSDVVRRAYLGDS